MDRSEGDWFRDGLRFSCTRCGACCTGAPGFVWVSSAEIAEIAAFLEESVDELGRTYVRMVGTALSLIEKPNGDCVFYDRHAKACTIYPVRPRQCRSWPFWESNVRTEQAWEETCRICPGAGRGELVPYEEVVRRVSEIRL
ncbi:MAG: YkgJ family cysteine cluster protein [Planctomycetes bacterium]|nr:YkgJ family cysteine cluster protein [Planctomycetota bacterium]